MSSTTQPPQYLEPIVFEGQLIRFLKEYGYVDAANGGLALAVSNGAGTRQNPAQSMWISRFYDRDVLQARVRTIEDHAEDLRRLICERIPNELANVPGASVDLGGPDFPEYRVILIAHSMGGLVHLHTGFLDTRLRPLGDTFSHFRQHGRVPLPIPPGRHTGWGVVRSRRGLARRNHRSGWH